MDFNSFGIPFIENVSYESPPPKQGVIKGGHNIVFLEESTNERNGLLGEKCN